MEEVRKHSAALVTPTKIIYIAYVVLLGLKVIPWHSFHVFALLSLAYWLVDTFIGGCLGMCMGKKA